MKPLHSSAIYITIILSVLLTIGLWLSQLYIFDGWYPTDSITRYTIFYKYIGKVTALATTILICWSFVLTSKLKLFSSVTTPNKININKVVTRWAFVLMFFDPLLLALNRLPNLGLFWQFFGFRYTSNTYGIGHNIGIVALLVIILITILLRQDWLDTGVKVFFRSFFGLIPFLLIAHIFFVKSDVTRYPVLGLWIFSWLSMSVLSYIWPKQNTNKKTVD